MQQFETQLAGFFGKLPPLSESIRLSLVKALPWITLAALVISVPAILLAFGLGALLGPLFALVNVGPSAANMPAVIVLVAAVVCEALSVPGLRARARRGWQFAFYAMLLTVVSSVISLDLLGAIVTFFLSGYILFQIRSSYTSK